jgi:hypothetical protein
MRRLHRRQSERQAVNAVPRTYAEWRRCITVECSIALTNPFLLERIADLRNPDNEHTRLFLHRWGTDHHQRVIGWFVAARLELERPS